MPAFADALVTDDLTILLGLVTASIFLLSNLYKPQPLVHPILLGRQSDVSRVRNPGESAVYRYYGTGIMGRFPVRPQRDVHTLIDHIKPGVDAPRTLWSTKITNNQIRERVIHFGAGLRRAGLKSSSNVLLLLNDSLEFLITDLALASQGIPSFTLSSPALLAPVLDVHPPTAVIIDASFLPHALEHVLDSAEAAHHVLIVLGEPDAQTTARAARGVRLVRWPDIEEEGRQSGVTELPAPPGSESVFTVSFYRDEEGNMQAAKLTHENLTAGVAAIRALVPPQNPLTALDTVVSAHSLSTAYGRAIAYTALLEGASFGTLEGTKLYKSDINSSPRPLDDLFTTKNLSLPSATMLFIMPSHLNALVNAVLERAKKSFIFPVAWRHKLSGILDGHVTRESLWDRLVLNDARVAILGAVAATLRGVVVSGGPLPADLLTPARIALSIPLVHAFTHPISTAPIFASHPHDLQTFAHALPVAHVGPPVVNIEVKMKGVDDAAIERGEDPVGKLFVRGPPIGRLMDDEDSTTENEGQEPWVATGVVARAQTNGSFAILEEGS
ncbi:acetyl-CoA synthetase-like protein [Vararia minispora EC-137]|uniref:Acetyl-CoA synthetase-like protein n=1 Tax=Vararia minispora EC-137 TaxID=1314806 RepID=A0ACB8QVV3_9AGAM|nr:acetyl-CoA synthetase-like protein [Vararia minispora EC-137]